MTPPEMGVILASLGTLRLSEDSPIKRHTQDRGTWFASCPEACCYPSLPAFPLLLILSFLFKIILAAYFL